MVSILQLVILIIPGVAFRVWILFAWCPRQGRRRGGPGKKVGVGAAKRANSFSVGLSCKALPGGPCGRLDGCHCLLSPAQKLQALLPQVYLVSEHLVVKGILVVKRSLK